MSILFSKLRVAPSTDFGCGGMPFECHAPHPGFALVGLQVRAGDWIDQVAPLFAEVHEDGTIGPETIGPSFGGRGGYPRQLRVAPGHLVTAMQTRSGHFMDGVRLLQTRWNGETLGDSMWTEWMTGGHMGGVERPERYCEPMGRAVIVGIAGRAATYVDNLTFICAELTRVTTTAVTSTARSGSKSTAAHAMG